MRFFLDTANLDEIRAAAALGVIEGVTTNPLLITKEKNTDFKAIVKEITSIINGPVSVEVISTVAEEMVTEARALAKIADNVVIKIPIGLEGLKAVKALRAEGIKTNVTLVFAASQALIAAKAGATFVSPFIGRLEDVNIDAMSMLRDICQIFSIYEFPTQIIAASVRTTTHAVQAALAGAHIATVPYKVLIGMVEHPMTNIVGKLFLDSWKAAMPAG